MGSAGYLNKFATFKQRVSVTSASVARSFDYQDVAGLIRVQVGYRPEPGFEREAASSFEAAEQGVIRIRSAALSRQIKADWVGVLHLGHEDREFTIRHTDNRDRKDRYLHLHVEFGTVQR